MLKLNNNICAIIGKGGDPNEQSDSNHKSGSSLKNSMSKKSKDSSKSKKSVGKSPTRT